MKSLIFLYSSGDVKQLQMLAKLASEDSVVTGYRPWLDILDTSNDQIESLSSSKEVDPQIAEMIAEADAIVYCVGSTGAGVYQRSVETGLAKAAVERRASTANPIRFIPVLLNDGAQSDLPDWAQRYTIVNHDRTQSHPVMLWWQIRQRLNVPAEKISQSEPAAPALPSDPIERLVAPLVDRPQLTIFIGPYALERQGDIAAGPAAVTQELLADIGVAQDRGVPILPWPSEAAEWHSFAGSRHRVHQLLRKRLAPLGFNPPDLAHSIGQLAARWVARHGERDQREKDWQGLLLLTTRVDLALESALVRQAKVDFTRILPTLNNSEASADRRRLVQQWRPDPGWSSDPTPAGSTTAPCDDVTTEQPDQLSTFPLDKAKRIILVKLCGTLEIPASLVLTGYDFFKNAGNFSALPKGINEAISTSPHLFLGHGFASPLAQLVRLNVLPTLHPDLPRLWLLPDLPDGVATCGDVLCDLELKLLDEHEKDFLNALNASAVCRGPNHVFVRRLAERI